MKNHLITALLFLTLHYPTFAQLPELWGSMAIGSSFGIGTIFKIKGDGSQYTRLYDFGGGTNGGSCQANFTTAGGNLFYGVTVSGGQHNVGDIFRYNTATGQYFSLHSMDSLAGYYPRSGLLLANNSLLYGVCNNGGTNDLGTFFSFNPSNNNYTKIVDFTGPNGQYPYGQPVQASDNHIYGITSTGGNGGGGIIYKYNISNNSFTTVHHFVFGTGFLAYGSLVEYNGLLYGMAFGGGTLGYGVIFSFNPANNDYQVLYNFNGTSGSAPWGTMTIGPNGVFYSNTTQGGINNKGVIFRFDTNGNVYTKLHDYESATGISPYGNLLLASDGKLYGMCIQGGANNLGTIISFDPNSATFTKIYDGSFSDGGQPYADLIEYTVPNSVEETTLTDLGITLFPNPATEHFRIIRKSGISGRIEMEISDALGRIVRQPGLEATEEQISISLPKGIYSIRFTLGHRTATGRVLVL